MENKKINMQFIQKYKTAFIILFLTGAVFGSCKKDGNPNDLPGVSPEAYAGKIDGYDSSGQIFPDNLIAYWSFDDTKAERFTGNNPTMSLNDAFVANGVRGKALSLDSGYLYYGMQFPQFKTDEIKSFSISMWTKIKNNGSKRTMLFQLARPGIFNGNLNIALNTNQYPASNDSTLRLQPTFSTVNSATGGSLQDNLNTQIDKFNLNEWLHIVLTYDITTGVFNNWINGRKVGQFPNRGTTNIFKSWEPNEVIIGANYNSIPGKIVNTDVNFAPMRGQIDEIRFFDVPLPDAHIKALYNLGLAGK
jgi:hypothetical protein